MLLEHFHVVKIDNDKIFFLLSVDIIDDEKFKDLFDFFPSGKFLGEHITQDWGYPYDEFPGYRGNLTSENASSRMIKLCNLLNHLFPRKQNCKQESYEVLA